MSYVGTAKKHGVNAFTAIQAALNDNPYIIFEQLGSEQLQNNNVLPSCVQIGMIQ